jgi:enoyl-CoA hydratase
MYQTIKYEVKENVATITISRPEALNALNSTVLEELFEAFQEVDKDEAVRCVIVTGDGRSFVAGADIAEMSTLNPVEAKRFAQKGHKLMNFIEKTEKPVIAAVNGFALGGGCELAMACDIRLASSKALFGQPETGLGITPGFGGTQRLSKIVGPGNASLLILTAQNIKADEALRIGLVQKVYEPEQLMEEAEKLAKVIAGNAPVAVMASKTLINKGYGLDLFSGCALEAEGFGVCFGTTDQKEGMKAFLSKGKYEYQGK